VLLLQEARIVVLRQVQLLRPRDDGVVDNLDDVASFIFFLICLICAMYSDQWRYSPWTGGSPATMSGR